MFSACRILAIGFIITFFMVPIAIGQNFVEVTSVDLEDVYLGSLDWADYDNDGDLDILVTGFDPNTNSIAYLYENDGGSFSNIGANLQGVGSSAATWGDYDNDGDLDVILSGINSGTRYTELYRNDGNGVFSNRPVGITGMSVGALAWGDYDNDGDQDLFILGDDGGNDLATIYRNDGNDTFVDIDPGIPILTHGDVNWVDFDNDGDLDLSLTGRHDSDNYVVWLYRNDVDGNGNHTFVQLSTNFTGIRYSALDWGDYDSDGDLDIVICGNIDTDNNHHSAIYRNDGGDFVNINAGMTEVRQGDVRWGDYDNDGDLDVLLTGDATVNDPIPFTEMYRNDGGDNFTQLQTAMVGLRRATIEPGDYDNDGDLDVAICGATPENGRTTRLYRNDATPANTVPTAPTGLNASVSGNTVMLSWNTSSDNETDTAALTYNVRIGTNSGEDDVVSGLALSDGWRLLPRLGNVQQNTSFSFVGLEDGMYYWSVQAIDTQYAGSAFSTENTFTVGSSTSIDDDEATAVRTALGANYPNPFNPSTTIPYDLARSGDVQLTIYNTAGQHIRTLVDGAHDSGQYSAVWDGRNARGDGVASGVYFYRLQVDDGLVDQKSMILLK